MRGDAHVRFGGRAGETTGREPGTAPRPDPYCTAPPVRCHVHHLIPRSKGGPTRLDNLTLLCHFHHLVVIHRWGWALTLHADGTTTAKSPDGIRTLHSHGPPPGQDTLWADRPSHGPPATAA